jgi:hypothetical protein
MHDVGRLDELRKVAVQFDLDVDIVHAVRPNSPMGTTPSYFIVAENGVLLHEPRHIGGDFESSYSSLHDMKTSDTIFRLSRSEPYYGG